MSTLESLITDYNLLNEQLAACILEGSPAEEKQQEFKNKYAEIEAYVKNNAMLKQVMLLRKIGMI